LQGVCAVERRDCVEEDIGVEGDEGGIGV